jgi:ketosteroid isomerase-like protein
MTRRSIIFAGMAMLASIPLSARPGDARDASTVVDSVPDATGPAAVVEAFHSALKSGDTNAALALLGADVLIYEEGGAERTRAEYASHHLAADAAFAAATSHTIVRRTGGVSGNLAWVSSEGRTTGLYKTRPVDRVTAETMVLRRDRDGWRIEHIHWSSRVSTRR